MLIKYIDINNCTSNTFKVKKKFKYCTNIPLILSHLSYNFGKLLKNRLLTCSLSDRQFDEMQLSVSTFCTLLTQL